MASTDTKAKGIRRLLHLGTHPHSSHHPLIPTPHPPMGPTTTANSKKPFAFRGLGCASSSSAAALLPDSAAVAAVRSSADWQGERRTKTKKKKKKRKKKRKMERGSATSAYGVADVSDVWCAPGVVFGAEASVDCVVAHRRERERERERVHRERRHGGGEEMLSSLLGFGSTVEDRNFGSGSGSDPPTLVHLRHLREGGGGGGGDYRQPPAEFEEMMMFQTRVLLGGMDLYDRYKDLRLDVDNMSYEELLELSEKIGYVSTGLREEEILHNLRKAKHSFFGASPSKKDSKCIICQEEYEVNDDMGRLECGHTYHTHCIKQWLLRKNTCPVCKIAITKT